MTTTTKAIGATAYITIQADLAAQEGPVSARLAHLYFQLTQVRGKRTVEQWDHLVVEAMRADVTIAEVIEFGEE